MEVEAEPMEEEEDTRFPPAEWRRIPPRHAAARRERPYRWPFAREPLYDGDDAIYGPYGYGEEGREPEDERSVGAARERAWRRAERVASPERVLGYPERAFPYEEGEELSRRRRGPGVERRHPRARSRGRHSFLGQGPKGYRRSDERIYEEIAERLTEDAFVDPSDVEVRVDSGQVTLTGTVQDRWMKHEIEDVADAVAGVEDIENQIKIRRPEDRG